ncbi:MAG: porin family protein [Endomicrobium sp.]|nr:porin family protein [Endomicrobium sp.]
MKKVLLPLLMFFVFSGVLSAKGFYIGGTGGMAGTDNFKDCKNEIKETNPYATVDLSQSKFFYGLEIGYESPLISENQLLGVRGGYNWHDTISFDVKANNGGRTIFKNKMQSIPVTAYYKYEFKESKFSVLGGVGLTIIDMKWIYTYSFESGGSKESSEENKNVSKASPHIAVGLEYRFSKLLGLSFDLKYTIGSEIKFDDSASTAKRELGFQGALAVRLYAF